MTVITEILVCFQLDRILSFLDSSACLSFLSLLFQNTLSIGIQMHFLTLHEGLTWNVLWKRGKIFGHWKKFQIESNLTIGKEVDLYKATLNSKTEVPTGTP